jgi:hypothetical protein
MSLLTNTAKAETIQRQGERLLDTLGYDSKRLYKVNHSRGITREESLIRGIMMYQLRQCCGYTMEASANIFRMNTASCSYWCNKIRDYESINDDVVMQYVEYIKP